METKKAFGKSEGRLKQFSCFSVASKSRSETVTATKGLLSEPEAAETFADSSNIVVKSEAVVTTAAVTLNRCSEQMTLAPILNPKVSTSSKPPVNASIKVNNTPKGTTDEEQLVFALPKTDDGKTSGFNRTTALKSNSSLVDSSSIGSKTDSVSADEVPFLVPTKKSKQKRGRIDVLIRCTACNVQIGTTVTSEAFQHPMLKVLICKKCYKWYVSAEIVQGSDGKDEQCRWCSDGGDLICCDFCHNAICKGCIRRNLGRKSLMDILNADEDTKWSCYVCDPTPLGHLIKQCEAVLEKLTTEKTHKKKLTQQDKSNSQKKDAQQKTETMFLQSVSQTNDVLPANLLPLFKSQQQIVNNSFVNSRSSVNIDTNVRQTASKSLSNRPSLLPSFCNRETSATGMSTNLGSFERRSVSLMEVVNELMSANNSRLNTLLLLSEELSLAGKRSSSLESMPVLAVERRKIAERLWITHNNYLRSFQNVLQRLRPIMHSVDLKKDRGSLTLVGNFLPRFEPRMSSLTCAVDWSRQDNKVRSTSDELVSSNVSSNRHMMVQDHVTEGLMVVQFPREVGVATASVQPGMGTTNNPSPEQNQPSLNRKDQAETLLINKRGRKRKLPATFC